MQNFEKTYHQVKRATVARSVLDVIAIIFLIAGFAFWGVAFWQLLIPPALLSLLSIQAVVLALAFSLAAPLLLSMLVPTTPAGQMLQRTQWGTIGFYVILGAGLYLTYQAEQLIETWLYAQPAIRNAGWDRRLAIVLTIAFVVVPALAWVQLTPERWGAAVQQAHEVKKLEMQQRGELAIIKASMIRAETLAAIGWANLLPLEREEAINSVRGLLMASSDTMRTIIRTLGLSAELEREIMGDEEIAAQLDYVRRELNIVPSLEWDTAPEPPQNRATTLLAPRQDAAPVSPPRPVSAAGNVAPQRPAAPRSAPQRYTVDYETALAGLTGAWSVHALADVLGVAERTARDRLNTWLEDGRAAASDTKGRFYFTESGAA